jgi:predicted phage terminase large subunit-like protein
VPWANYIIIVLDPFSLVLLLSQTQNQVQALLSHVRREFESNQLLMNDFGSFSLGSNEWGKDALFLPRQDAKIVAASAEQSIRGMRYQQHRPDLIIADDIDDYSSTRTRESRNKTYSWFKGEIVPAGDDHTRIIVIGNLLHEDALVMRLKDMVSAHPETGRYHYFPIMKYIGTFDEKRVYHILWKGKYPKMTSIQALEKKVSDHVAWKREFLLQLTPEQDQVIQNKWIHHYTHIPDKANEQNKYRTTAVGVDLAIVEKDTADYTAVVTASVFEWGDKMRIYIHPYPTNKRLNFPRQREELKRVSDQIERHQKIYIEDVGFQVSLVEQLKGDGIYNAEGVNPGSRDKRSRLMLTSYYIKNGVILFPKTGCEELIMQLTGFGIEKHDDLADAFSLLILKLIDRYLRVSESVTMNTDEGKGSTIFGDLTKQRF